MARRGKPLPGRRGRLRSETTVTEVTTEASAEPSGESDEPVVVEETRVSRNTTAATGGGLEMALVVVTLISLVAAFLLLQVAMRSAYGEGWPV